MYSRLEGQSERTFWDYFRFPIAKSKRDFVKKKTTSNLSIEKNAEETRVFKTS